MKIIILLLFYFLFIAQTFPKYRAWSDANENILIKHYPESSRLPNETDEQLMDRWDLITDMPAPGFVTLTIDDIIPTDRSDREKWRIGEREGKKVIFVSSEAPSPEKDKREKRKNDIQSAKAKLRSGQPMDANEVEALFPN